MNLPLITDVTVDVSVVDTDDERVMDAVVVAVVPVLVSVVVGVSDTVVVGLEVSDDVTVVEGDVMRHRVSVQDPSRMPSTTARSVVANSAQSVFTYMALSEHTTACVFVKLFFSSTAYRSALAPSLHLDAL